MKHILFFALKEDLLALLELVESKGSLKYVRMGNFSAEQIKDGPSVYSFRSSCFGTHLREAPASSRPSRATRSAKQSFGMGPFRSWSFGTR